MSTLPSTVPVEHTKFNTSGEYIDNPDRERIKNNITDEDTTAEKIQEKDTLTKGCGAFSK